MLLIKGWRGWNDNATDDNYDRMSRPFMSDFFSWFMHFCWEFVWDNDKRALHAFFQCSLPLFLALGWDSKMRVIKGGVFAGTYEEILSVTIKYVFVEWGLWAIFVQQLSSPGQQYHSIKLSGQRTQTSATSRRILGALAAMVEIITEGSMAGFVLMSPLRFNMDVLHEMV